MSWLCGVASVCQRRCLDVQFASVDVRGRKPRLVRACVLRVDGYLRRSMVGMLRCLARYEVEKRREKD